MVRAFLQENIFAQRYLCINSDLMIMLYFCAYCCVVGVGVCETGNGK